MLADIELPFHPTATDCLAWSDDGSLAVAAGGFVHLLVRVSTMCITLDLHAHGYQIPRRGVANDENNAFKSNPWVHINFRIDTYTTDEWPPQKLDDLDDFCIGEEQSTSTVVKLSWSPIGLAKHKRPTLAVLTTNHVLSLWASASNPNFASTWQRVLVINKAFENPLYDDSLDREDDLPSCPRSRKLSRVRSMSWAPSDLSKSLSTEEDDANFPHNASKPVQYLAVTNDADEVAVVQIKSPWLHHERSWVARVMCRASWESLKQLLMSTQISDIGGANQLSVAAGRTRWPSVLAKYRSKRTFIDHVSCVPCHNSRAGLGLILCKDWESLQCDVSSDAFIEGSTTDVWIPVSCSKHHASSSNGASPSLDYSCAELSSKVFHFLRQIR